MIYVIILQYRYERIIWIRNPTFTNFLYYYYRHLSGDERTETYYFRLDEPILDQEIVDYAISSEYMINKVFL